LSNRDPGVKVVWQHSIATVLQACKAVYVI
jgi:hypothetical protein